MMFFYVKVCNPALQFLEKNNLKYENLFWKREKRGKRLTCMLMIRGSGCLVFAPPSMAMPRIDLVFFTVMRRLPWWSGTTRAPSSSLRSDISLRDSRCTLWWRRGGPPAVPPPTGPPPAPPPSSSNCASCMSKLRESLCASSWNGHILHSHGGGWVSGTPSAASCRIRDSNRKSYFRIRK